MPKRVKITLYVILILAIIAVVWLMFWIKNSNVENPTDTNIEILTWEEIEEPLDTINLEMEDWSFEEDVMQDLEWFFNDNKGYEDVQGEYWFTNPENE